MALIGDEMKKFRFELPNSFHIQAPFYPTTLASVSSFRATERFCNFIIFTNFLYNKIQNVVQNNNCSPSFCVRCRLVRMGLVHIIHVEVEKNKTEREHLLGSEIGVLGGKCLIWFRCIKIISKYLRL